MTEPTPDSDLLAFANKLRDRYADLEPLGGGGMAELLVGRERTLNRRVVIKRVSSRLDSVDARDRFQSEIALLASLQHPNIVPLLTAGTVDDVPYFVMPLVRGESLSERLTRGPLSVRETVAILEDVAQALESAHAAGVVHRDIKPGNILLTGSAAVVADFGIAKAVSRRLGNTPVPMRTPSDLTLAGFSLGTPRYMSPEQFAADPGADHRVDLYSLGVVAYEMLVGVPPFAGPTPSALARAHVAEPPAPLRTRRADIPPALDALILKCLEKDPALRPSSVAELLRALRSPSLLAIAPGTTREVAEPEPASRHAVGDALRELRRAWRTLRRAPVVFAACVFCMAIGLGSAATIYSVADRVLLRPVDFDEAHRLVSIFRALPSSRELPFSAPNFVDIAGEPSAEGIAAFASTSRLLALGDRYEPSFVIRTSGQFFNVLRTRALHGRVLLPSDDVPDAPAVVVVSYEYWRSHLGGSPGIVGSSLRLDGEPHEVVGVLPPRFRITNSGTTYAGELWVPMRFSESELRQRTSNFLRVFGRLGSQQQPEGLQAALIQRFAPLLEAYPELEGHSIAVTPLVHDAAGSARRSLALLIVATFVVLIIAVINVSSLLLARGISRQRELGVRTALGATRWEVMRPVFAEGIVIALCGWVTGLGLALLALKMVVALGSTRITQLEYAAVDLRTAGVALLAAIVAALAGTAAPAWRAALALPADVLRGGRGSGAQHQHRTLAALVVIEGALAVTLLISAGLVTKGFVRAMNEDPGFDVARVLTLRVRVAPTDFPADRAATAFLTPALEAIQRIPGVEAAGAISQLPYNEWGWNAWVRYEGRPEVPPTERPLIETRNITPGFFAATGQQLVAGRLLDARDMMDGDTIQRVVVNSALAARDFPDGDILGKRFFLGERPIEIVGVVSDIRNFGPLTEPRPEAYWTFAQRHPQAVGYSLVIRTQQANPAVIAADVEQALRAVYPGVAVSRVKPMQVVMRESIGWPRFIFALFATLAGVALLLSLAGLFGILNYSVEQRRRDFAIRAALGAPPARLRRYVLSGAGRLVAMSLALGAAVSWGVTRLMASLLFGVEPRDAAVWTVALVSMALAGIAAAAGPAWRASRVQPMTVMRAE